MKDFPKNWNKATIFNAEFHYRKKGYQCERCSAYGVHRDCFFPKPVQGRPPIGACTNCKRLKKGCHNPSIHRVSESPELGEMNRQKNDESRALHLRSMAQQSKSKSSAAHSATRLGKRKARSPEPTTMDHVSSSSRHDSDSDSDSQHAITPPPVSTSSSRIDFNNLPPRTDAMSGKIVVRHIPIPSAFRVSSSSSSFTHSRTRFHPEHENPIPSSIQPSSSSATSFNPARTNPERHPKVPRASLSNNFPSSNQPSSSSTPLAPACTNPPHETQPQASADTAVRQMEHVNATMVALYEALEGEMREAEEADRTRRARIYRIENAMKMVNRDVRAADNALHTLIASGPISVEDHAQLDPELDRYRQTLAMLQDRRVHRDRAAQERQRREKEHRDLLDDELLSRLEKR